MVGALLTFGANNRLLAFAILVVLTLAAALGMPKLKTDTSRATVISDEDPGWPAYRKAVAEFGSDNITIIYVGDKDLFTGEKLAKLEKLFYELRDVDIIDNVEGIFDVSNMRYRGEGLEVGPLIDGVTGDPVELDAARSAATGNPLIQGNLISKDGTATALVVSVTPDKEDKKFLKKVRDLIEEKITPLRDDFEQVFQLGSPRLENDLAQGLADDFKILLPLSILILVASVVIFLRTPRFAIIPVATSLVSIVWTFGFMGYVGLPVTLLSVMVPSLIIVIGSTEATHLLASYLDGLREGETPTREVAIRFMARHMGLPILITSFTTTLGFGSNALSAIPMIQEFAYATAFAMFANLVATILLVPLFLSILGPTKAPKGHDGGEPRGLIGLITRFFETVSLNYGMWVLVGVTILVAAVGSFAFKIKVNNDPMANFRPESELRRNADTLHENLAGMQVFNMTFSSQEPGAFKQPENLKKIESISKFMRDMGVFDKVVSLVDYVALVNQEMNEGKEEFFTVPNTSEEIEQFLLMFSRGNLDAYVSSDYRNAKVLVRHNVSDSHALNQHLEKVREELDRLTGDKVEYALVGENLMINNGAEALVAGQLQSLLLLIVVIYAIMSFLFTSLAAGLVSLVPNLLPLILNFGTMGLLGIPLNPGTALVAAIAMGIAIDDTSHLMVRYNDECRKHRDQDEAIRATVRAEAVPVISTSIGLAAMFATLVFSSFSNIAQFGLLAAATMIYALIADLLVTPLILRRVRLVGVWQLVTFKMGTQVLLDSPIFRGMSSNQIRKAILLSETMEVDAGDIVIMEGTTGRDMYLVLAGEVQVLRSASEAKGGKKGKGKSDVVKVATLTPGEIFGELGFVGETARTATVMATQKSTLLVFSSEGKNKALRLYPHILAKLNHNISRTIGERLAEATRRSPEISY